MVIYYHQLKYYHYDHSIKYAIAYKNDNITFTIKYWYHRMVSKSYN